MINAERREWARREAARLRGYDDEAAHTTEELPIPTDEQLERVAIALGFPILIGKLRPPHYREALLNLHGLVQKTADGDAGAAQTLAFLRERFAQRRSGA